MSGTQDAILASACLALACHVLQLFDGSDDLADLTWQGEAK